MTSLIWMTGCITGQIESKECKYKCSAKYDSDATTWLREILRGEQLCWLPCNVNCLLSWPCTLVKVIVISIKSCGGCHHERLAAESSANREWDYKPPCKMHNLPRPMGRPGKGQRVDGEVKSVGEFQNKSTSRVKKRKGGHGNVSAGRWPETEVNRRREGDSSSVGVVTVTVHTFLQLTLCAPPIPSPPIQQHSVSGNASYLQQSHNASGLVCEFWFVSNAQCLQMEN